MKSTNIKWHRSKITTPEIEDKQGHKGCVLWFTGLSASGKSTLAVELERRLFDSGHRVTVLDGDNVRHGLNKNLGFSQEDREENIRRISEVAKLFRAVGMIVITAFISPYRRDRDMARALFNDNSFKEFYVKCNIDECKKRDPKGLYQKAIDGVIKEFTGISAPYEAPETPELVVETDKNDIETCVDQIIEYLKESKVIDINGDSGII